jgi:exonuclease III
MAMKCEILSYNTHGLPWSRDTSKEIVEWLKTIKPGIICLQEVFCESTRLFYKEHLERSGYFVSIPNDTNITFLSSGLLIACLESKYKLVSECFCSFQDYHNVEMFANKGFHTVRLIDTKMNRPLIISNTHVQSNTEISWFFGTTASDYRKKQMTQILSFFSYATQPILLAGDMNCEYSPHSHLRFLRTSNDLHSSKHTFYETGEDLDHIGWIPLQWANLGCHYCDVNKLGPIMESCEVFQKPWSDHAPIRAIISIPDRKVVVSNFL